MPNLSTVVSIDTRTVRVSRGRRVVCRIGARDALDGTVSELLGALAEPQSIRTRCQIYEQRVLLEAEAAGLAARSHRPADLVRLEGLLARDRALREPDDVTRIRANLELYSAIWQATHDPVLVDLLERLTTRLAYAPQLTLSVGDRRREALDEHTRLLDAIRDHDEPTARAVAVEHMATARQIRLHLLRNAAAQAGDLAGQDRSSFSAAELQFTPRAGRAAPIAH